MECVPELVKQRHDIIMGQQRQLLLAGRVKVANEVGYGQLAQSSEFRSHEALIHPGTTALVWARERVKEETSQYLALCRGNLEVTNVRVPGVDAFPFG